MGLLHQLIVSTLPLVPRPLMRRLAARYIAGETLGEALSRLRHWSERGFAGVLDILGEDVSDEAEAHDAVQAYCSAASRIAEENLDAYVSVKPTHFGLRISPQVAHDNFTELLEHCSGLGQHVRVEMEDHTTTDDTLALFKRLAERFDDVGIVLQARLLRTPADIEALGEAPVDVRMVKGIYLEAASIAHTDRQAISDAFVSCTDQLFERGHSVALATHDDKLAERILKGIQERGVDSGRFRFEVLMGVQERLWERWRSAGHRVLVYVPFGPQWRGYSQRRLAKNPEVLRHLILNVFR